ncbi:MAG: hypothetical protein EBR82_47180 [Caulobacteraceae bacterium]|nr:hypothetical protein [Caulobacteraceae bacterium]
MKNVIMFPKEKLDSPPQSLDDMLNKLEDNQREAVEEALDKVIPGLIASLAKYNLYISDEKDLGMVIEAVKSGIFRTIKIKHNLQEITDQLIKIV